MNKYKKTPTTQRKSYNYTFADQSHFTLNSEVLMKDRDYLKKLKENSDVFHPDQMIAYLHRADDRIVDNNLKNSELPNNMVNRQMKKEWEESHPGEKYTGHWHLRLDGCTSSNSDNEYAEDKNPLLKEAYASLKEAEPNLIIERLHEIVSDFSTEWKEVYELVLIHGYSMTEVAKMQNVTESAVRKKVNKIKSRIASDEKINSYF